MSTNSKVAKYIGLRGGFRRYLEICYHLDSDLNLIHEAEDALTEEEWRLYLEALGDLIYGNPAYWLRSQYFKAKLFRHATAAQCAQALAKVLGQRDPK